MRPISFNSNSTVLRHVVFDLPGFLSLVVFTSLEAYEDKFLWFSQYVANLPDPALLHFNNYAVTACLLIPVPSYYFTWPKDVADLS